MDNKKETYEVQYELKRIIGEGNIEQALSKIRDILIKNEAIEHRVLDSYIAISASYRNLNKKILSGVISSSESNSSENTIIDRIIRLVNELPLSEMNSSINDNNPAISDKTDALALFKKAQIDYIFTTRKELLGADNVINNLISQLIEKEKQLVIYKKEEEIKSLKREIEELRVEISKAESRYTEIKQNYEKLKDYQTKSNNLIETVDELQKRIQTLKDTLKDKENVILELKKVVHNGLVVNDNLKVIDELRKEIEELKKRATPFKKKITETLDIINSLFFLLVLIFLLALIVRAVF